MVSLAAWPTELALYLMQSADLLCCTDTAPGRAHSQAPAPAARLCFLLLFSHTLKRHDTTPVVLLNVANFYDPLRAFIDGAVKSGFISDECRAFLTFVDKPVNVAECEFDWGEAALEALHVWTRQGAGGGIPYGLDWS